MFLGRPIEGTRDGLEGLLVGKQALPLGIASQEGSHAWLDTGAEGLESFLDGGLTAQLPLGLDLACPESAPLGSEVSWRGFLTWRALNLGLRTGIEESTDAFLLKEPGMTNLKYPKLDLSPSSRFSKRLTPTMDPILATRPPLPQGQLGGLGQRELSLVEASFNRERMMVSKIASDQTFLVIKQKRYTRKKEIPMRARNYRNPDSIRYTKVKFSDRPRLVANSFFESLDVNPTSLYRLVKKNKIRDESMPVQLARRMLRTKRSLVLPAHVNLGLLTNSYDVVHSWFLPSLGIKLDCVPGRSTHHVFFCDAVGFYYGQCAEICGRYHHHMPIRLCILPFEHFNVWWHHFGLPRVLGTFPGRSNDLDYGQRSFTW
jgi:hypothetical protein